MMHFSSHIVRCSASLKDGLVAINRLTDQILTLLVIDADDMLVGTVTDGDIRRALIRGISLADPLSQVMNRSFCMLRKNERIVPGDIRRYRSSGIDLLPLVDGHGKICRVYNLTEKRSILPVDAVLMAGGRGLRLMPLTENTPKPLLLVGNKPIIDYNIERLLKYGIEHITITVNYLAEQIEEHFAGGRDEASIACIREPEYLGTIGSVKLVSHFFHDTVLLMNSDIFTNIDLDDFYQHFSDSDADMSVAAVPYSVTLPYGILELEDQDIRGFHEKPMYTYYANAGIYLIKRSLLQLIPNRTYFDATDFMELLIAQGYKVVRFPLIGLWVDIGKPEDFKKVQEFADHIRP